MKRDPVADPKASIRRVYSYVAYRIGSGADAEDVTSEVMLRAVQYRSSYDAARGKPTTWLLGIARSCVNDHLASRKIILSEWLDVAAPGDVELETVHRVGVARAVSRLDDHDRELIALRYGADLSTREISRLVGLSPNAIDVALHRTRQRLSIELDREGYGRNGPSVSTLRTVAETGA